MSSKQAWATKRDPVSEATNQNSISNPKFSRAVNRQAKKPDPAAESQRFRMLGTLKEKAPGRVAMATGLTTLFGDIVGDNWLTLRPGCELLFHPPG